MVTAIRAFAATGLVSLSSVAAVAHPGHGHPGHPDGVMHVLTSPSHFVSWALGAGVAAVLLVVAARFARRLRGRRQAHVVVPRRGTQD